MKNHHPAPMSLKGTKNLKPSQKTPDHKADTGYTGKWAWLALAAVAMVTFIIYFRTIGFGYVWDDDLYILQNNHINDIRWENIKLFFTNFYAGNYQPATILLYAAEHKLFRDSSAFLHVNNILLHAANTFLVFMLIRRISPGNIAVALITAALFAVHPMHVESVAWISGRKDVLYSFFFLLSLIMYSSYLKKQTFTPLALTALFFVLSCLSKSGAVVLPLVMLLLDYYSNREYCRKMLVEKIPFFCISIVFGIAALYSQKSSIQDMAPVMSVPDHVSVVASSFISYIFKAIVPLNLSAFYPYPPETGHTLPAIYYLSVICVGILLLCVCYSRRSGKDIVFGFLFFTSTIILVLQLIPVGAATMADRYTYIPYIGIFFLIGKLYERTSGHAGSTVNLKAISSMVVIAGFIALSAISYQRTAVWENNATLFTDAINKFPYANFPYFIRGTYYLNSYEKPAGNEIRNEAYLKMAVSDFGNAIKFTTDPKRKADIYYNLGSAKGSSGDFAGAAGAYDKSIELNPGYGDTYLNRGAVYLNYYANELYAGQTIRRVEYIKKAISDFENALKFNANPNESGGVSYNLGIAKYNLGDYAGTVCDLERVIRVDENNANAYNILGCAKYQLKDYKGALQDFNKLLQLNPRDSNAIKNRDLVTATILSRR